MLRGRDFRRSTRHQTMNGMLTSESLRWRVRERLTDEHVAGYQRDGAVYV